MKKRSPSKPKRPTSILSNQGTYKKDTPAKLQDNQDQKQPKDIKENKTSLLDIWKNIWAFLGPALTLLGAGAYWWPSLTLTSGVNLDPNQALQTQFVVTNTGHVPVHEVSFVCALVGARVTATGLITGPTLAPIETLRPGEAASRGCFVKSLTIDGPMLRVDAYYKWPLIGKFVNTRVYFKLQKGEAGNFLVPEATPAKDLPVLLHIGRSPI